MRCGGSDWKLVFVTAALILTMASPVLAAESPASSDKAAGKNASSIKGGKPSVGPPSTNEAGRSTVLHVCGTKNGPGRADLYDTEPIRLEVAGLRDWMKGHGNNVTGFVLYLDGRDVPKLPVRLVGRRIDDIGSDGDRCWGEKANIGYKAVKSAVIKAADAKDPAVREAAAKEAIAKDPQTDVLEFDLERNKDSNVAWKVLLARPDQWDFHRTFKVSLAVDGKSLPDATGGAELTLHVVDTLWGKVFLGILAAAIATLAWAGRATGMLRDTTRPVPADGRRPFSLGRCQMAFWFFLVVAAYVLIYLTTGDHQSLPKSALWLIGISSVTALGSVAVDVAKTKPNGAAPPPAVAAAAAPAPAAPPVIAGQALVQSVLFF